MKEPLSCRALTERSISKFLLVLDEVIAHECREYAAFGLSQAEFDAIRVPDAMGWRHFLRSQGLGSLPGTFDLKRTADVLAKFALTPRDFVELLDGIRDEVGADPDVSLLVLDRRLLAHLSQRKETL